MQAFLGPIKGQPRVLKLTPDFALNRFFAAGLRRLLNGRDFPGQGTRTQEGLSISSGSSDRTVAAIVTVAIATAKGCFAFHRLDDVPGQPKAQPAAGPRQLSLWSNFCRAP